MREFFSSPLNSSKGTNEDTRSSQAYRTISFDGWLLLYLSLLNCFLLQLPISQLGNACCFLLSHKWHHPDYKAAIKEESSFHKIRIFQSVVPPATTAFTWSAANYQKRCTALFSCKVTLIHRWVFTSHFRSLSVCQPSIFEHFRKYCSGQE